jgi:hypothetical protein
MEGRRAAVLSLPAVTGVAIVLWAVFPGSDLVVPGAWGAIAGVGYASLVLVASGASVRRWRRLLMAGQIAAFGVLVAAGLLWRSAFLGVLSLAAGSVCRLQEHLYQIEAAGGSRPKH